jgi:hypothetical protein
MTWTDIPRSPSRATLRQFAAVWLLFFSGLGVWHLLGQERLLLGWLLLVVAGGVGITGLVWPSVLRPIFVGWMMTVFPLGWLISGFLLALLFYGVFTPLAFWFRLRGRDSLQLKPCALPSYWQSKPTATDIASYYRQF